MVSAPAKSDRRTIRLGIVCARIPPAMRDGVETCFGIQDKTGQLRAPAIASDGTARFDFAVEVKRFGGDFAGPWVNGKAGERFVYLGWRPLHGARDGWIRRWKLALSDITPAQIERLGDGDVLVNHLSATEADRVWVGAREWTIERGTCGESTAGSHEEI